jgi:PAS domain S-box-containing protein
MNQSEAAIARILDEFPCLLIGMDDSFRVKFLNQKASAVLGYAAENLQAGEDSFMSVIFPAAKKREQIVSYFRELPEGSVQYQDCECKNSNGQERMINWIVRKRLEPVMREVPVWLIGFDITEAASIKKKLLKNEERLSMVSRATNDAAYEYNIKANTIAWIDGLSNTFGFDDFLEMKAMDFWNLHLHPDDRERVVSETRRTIKDPSLLNRTDEYRFLKRDGQYAIVYDKCIIIRDEEGHAIKMIGGLSDISDRKAIEKRLIEKNRRLSDLAHFNSHKVRGPLARILGLTNALQAEEHLLPEESRMVLKKLMEASNELDEMVRHMTQIATQ